MRLRGFVVSNMFTWLWNGISIGDNREEGIGDLIADEFNMYLHHQGERNGIPNKGWLRTIFYSLTQQLVRQDLLYWMLYVCF